MARCVRKVWKGKNTRRACFRNAEDACLYMVCSGAAYACVLSSALRVVPSPPLHVPICAAFFLWSYAPSRKECRVRVTACNSRYLPWR